MQRSARSPAAAAAVRAEQLPPPLTLLPQPLLPPGCLQAPPDAILGITEGFKVRPGCGPAAAQMEWPRLQHRWHVAPGHARSTHVSLHPSIARCTSADAMYDPCLRRAVVCWVQACNNPNKLNLGVGAYRTEVRRALAAAAAACAAVTLGAAAVHRLSAAAAALLAATVALQQVLRTLPDQCLTQLHMIRNRTASRWCWALPLPTLLQTLLQKPCSTGPPGCAGRQAAGAERGQRG